MLADKNGILQNRPMKISADIFPYEEVNITPLLDELEAQKEEDGTPALIERYIVDGKGYIQVIHFLSHQSPHKNEPARWPANPHGCKHYPSTQGFSGGVAEQSKQQTAFSKQQGESEGEVAHKFPASTPDHLPVGALQEEGLEQARKIREQLDSRPKGQKPHK